MKINKNKYLLIPIIIALLATAVLISQNIYIKDNNFTLYTEFLKDVSNNKVKEVFVASSPDINVRLKNGSIYKTDNPRSSSFKEMLLSKGIKVTENNYVPVTKSISIMFIFASLLAFIVLILKDTRILSKNFLAPDNLQGEICEESKLTFDSVAGNEEAKESVQDIVDFLKNPEKYAAYGARLPKGIILYGEPGTGKTLLAKAVAGEANVPFFAMSGSDFVQMYVGVGASRVRQLFKKAKACGRAVIFIDEIDAIGKKRDSSKSGGSEERDQTLNALLTEMSGFNDKEGIVVMAATNRLDMLDSALLRPGRFDRHIEVTLPDVLAREKILNLHLRNKPTGDISIKDWAAKTIYFSGAKLESLVNEAAIIACKENSKCIYDKHMDSAYSIALAGYEKKNRGYISTEDKKITAYHEIGHTVVSLKLLPLEKVSKVTIIPSTKGAGGYTISIPEEKQYQSKSYLEKRIMVLLGGRAAEEMIFGKDKITTGAYSDIKKSTELASNMMVEYGMGSSLGLLNLQELSKVTTVNSENIIKECKELLDRLYEETLSLLITNRELVESITADLLEKETLYYEDLKSKLIAF